MTPPRPSPARFLDAAWWPLAALPEALAALAGAHGLACDPGDESLPLDWWRADAAGTDDWVTWAGGRMGFEAVSVDAEVRDLAGFLGHGGPAIVALPRGGNPGFLALDGSRRGEPLFLRRDGGRVRAAAAMVEQLLTAPFVDDLRPEVDRVLDAAGIRPSRRERVAAAMIRERIGSEAITGLTLLRLPAGADFLRQFRHAGLPLRLAQIVGLFVLLYGAELWGWSLIGGATLAGRLDWGWLAAWALLAFTMLPCRLLAGWSEAVFSFETGRLIKSRLLAGALALPPDLVKRQGVGLLIGRVMESQALEGLALGGGFAVLVGLIELAFAAWVLQLGAAPGLHCALLAGFALLTLGLGLNYQKRITEWTGRRMRMTHYLVEAMVGHRTRLAQERPQRRDAAEDEQLAGYLAASRTMDGSGLRFGSGIALAWSVAALLALGPALAHAPTPGAAALAISLGGMMLAQRALGGIGGGLASLSRAGFAWGQVREIFRAGSRRDRAGLAGALPQGVAGSGPVVEARGLRYAHGDKHAPVLDGVSLAIDRGDRILVEGPSGGGKSTLAGLLTGLRQADGGLLLLNGLDRPTIGDAWHRHVTAAPQFHDNHILSGTLAFNLLMGRQWPPSDADLAEAEQLCEELGLGELLRRMPGGIHQRVGETGWQLSHGERSRIFLARALLQRAQVTILDESFSSLDPATMDLCLRTALQRAETLVVIAHP